MKTDSDLNDVVDALRRIVQAIRLTSHAAETTVGISGAQLFVLQQLALAPATSLGELASRTLTDQSSVSVVVSRLVRRRLVTRRPSPADARRVEISLTAAGQALLSRAPLPAQSLLVDAVRRVPRRDLLATKRVLAAVASAIGAGAEPPSMFFERAAPRGAAPTKSRVRPLR